jgi:hypothetical protein
MAFVDAIKYNRIRSMKGLPIGAIIPWSSDQASIPVGWVLCNGTTISNTRYPILFSIIGNSYGGTAGSTYRLPPLTSGQTGIVDIFRGHYSYFKQTQINAIPGNEVNRPSSSSLSNDPFWSIVGFGTNGDTGNNLQTFWTSTADVVGVERSTSINFPALYDDITITDGSFNFTTVFDGTELGDEHIPPHTHGADTEDVTSWVRRGGPVSGCTGGRWSDVSCTHTCDSGTVYRVAANPAAGSGGNVWYGNVPEDLQNNLNTTDGPTGVTGSGGGGNVRGVPRGGVPGGAGESGATVYEGGDGRVEGAMGAYQFGNILLTSRSNNQINNSAPHFHSPINYDLQGRFNVISPGLRDNISLNTVRINNTPGQNFCTINA